MYKNNAVRKRAVQLNSVSVLMNDIQILEFDKTVLVFVRQDYRDPETLKKWFEFEVSGSLSFTLQFTLKIECGRTVFECFYVRQII